MEFVATSPPVEGRDGLRGELGPSTRRSGWRWRGANACRMAASIEAADGCCGWGRIARRFGKERAAGISKWKAPDISQADKAVRAAEAKHRVKLRWQRAADREAGAEAVDDSLKLAVRSAAIRSDWHPFSRTVKPLWPFSEKQTSDTRTAAPSTTQGSSDHASKIMPRSAIRSSTTRLRPPRMEFVATSPTLATLPVATNLSAKWNQ